MKIGQLGNLLVKVLRLVGCEVFLESVTERRLPLPSQVKQVTPLSGSVIVVTRSSGF